jgi:hypothetical protein
MNSALTLLQDILLKQFGNTISELKKDQECDDYFGYNFKINSIKIKYRQAKITPKKVGQFVTLWKRNNQNITTPFDENDDFDYYIIATKEDDKLGYFIFTKSILIEKNILTSAKKEGKRGFRVYPNWVTTTSNQAEKTKTWQNDYFIEIDNNIPNKTTKLLSLMT